MSPKPLTLKQAADRLISKAKRNSDGCLICHLAINSSGYPTASWGGPRAWKCYAHRLIYMAINGKLVEGIVVRHKCDERKCIEINHLEPGTPGDNNRDTVERGRHRNQHSRGQ